jgi:S1-C subfamily serine protease
MPKAVQRPVVHACSQTSDRSVAAISVLAGCILVALLLVFGIGGQSFSPTGTPVTISDVPPNPAVSAAGSSSLIGSPAAGIGVTGRAVGQGLSLTPRLNDGYNTGFQVGDASDAAVLGATRLRAGDVLLEVDGQPLDGERARNLAAELSTLDRVEIRFERNGLVRSRTIELNAAM